MGREQPHGPFTCWAELIHDPSLGPLRVFLCRALGGLSPRAWDALLEPEDQPLLSWAYLDGLEVTGCVGPNTGWLPAHLLVSVAAPDEDGREPTSLVAAMPLYVKLHSDGEWVFDLDWASWAAAHGVAYYPKLVSAVPFNPVGGTRLLTLPSLSEAQRASLRDLLLRLVLVLAKNIGCTSTHLLFVRSPSEPHMDAHGFLRRSQEQYHFLNAGFRSFDDYLAGLRSRRRSTICRERRALAAAGIQVRSYRGLMGHADAVAEGRDSVLPFSKEQLDVVFDAYVGTSRRYTGELPYLNRAFFHLCAQRLGTRLELVLAHDREGEVVGCAWNLLSDTRRFGRYWGELRHLPFLHFEVCYYHSIASCIAEGRAVFEPGHGGEHKLIRGFTPVLTHSAHHFFSDELREPIGQFLVAEQQWVRASCEVARGHASFHRPLSSPSSDVRGNEPGEE